MWWPFKMSDGDENYVYIHINSVFERLMCVVLLVTLIKAVKIVGHWQEVPNQSDWLPR